MNLTKMRALVRRDLKDEDSNNYRFSDNEIDRAISRALREFSQHFPRDMKTTVATTANSRNLDISRLTDRVSVDLVEYPIDKYPKQFRNFTVYQDTLTMGEPYDRSKPDTVPDGSNCYVYWGKLHTLDAFTSTIPAQYEDLVALGACAYAIIAHSQYTTERVTVGGRDTDRDYSFWGGDRLRQFQGGLKRLSRSRKLKVSRFYD